MHGPALIGSALFLYQFLAHRCAILYTRLFSPVLFPAYSFLYPEKSERLQGRPAYTAASPGAKPAKTDDVSPYLWESSCIQALFSGRTPPPALAAAFWGRSEGGLSAESAVRPFFSACKCPPEALPPLDSPPELRPPPSLYTARPICWLTFPLGSDTISIKHRKGRPAPWPSS